MITILYFARLREAFGMASEHIALPADVRDLKSLRELLGSRGGAWAEELADGGPVRAAINQEMADGDTPIVDGDEIALFLPVTGG
jgi:molybdopterin synthase sulfur carrier subunit